jgi:hypothetical protein
MKGPGRRIVRERGKRKCNRGAKESGKEGRREGAGAGEEE